jgi:hypothetical protein
MPTEKPILDITFPANTDLSSYQYCLVALNSSGKLVVATTSGQKITGVLKDAPDTANDPGLVGVQGVQFVKLGGTVSVDDPLTTNASSVAIVATGDDQFIFGRALLAGVSGDVIPVLIETRLGTLLDDSESGRRRVGVVRFEFDPSANALLRPIATYTLDQTLPNKAIVTRSFYEVITTFTSATDAATIALQNAQVANAYKSAVAISNGANPWDDGYHEGIQDGTAANFAAKLTAERAITIAVAVEALTAGKLVGWLEYVVSDAG